MYVSTPEFRTCRSVVCSQQGSLHTTSNRSEHAVSDRTASVVSTTRGPAAAGRSVRPGDVRRARLRRRAGAARGCGRQPRPTRPGGDPRQRDDAPRRGGVRRAGGLRRNACHYLARLPVVTGGALGNPHLARLRTIHSARRVRHRGHVASAGSRARSNGCATRALSVTADTEVHAAGPTRHPSLSGTPRLRTPCRAVATAGTPARGRIRAYSPAHPCVRTVEPLTSLVFQGFLHHANR